MKIEKNGVIKVIPKNLVSTYLNLGWKEYKKPIKTTPKFVEKKEEE